MNRVQQREWTVRLLYEMDADGEWDKAPEERLKAHELSLDNTYILDSLRSVSENKEEIDSLIKSALTNWNFTRILRMDLSILRNSINEFYLTKAVPVQVSINEAVELAKEYSGENSYRFINGVLSNLAKRME